MWTSQIPFFHFEVLKKDYCAKGGVARPSPHLQPTRSGILASQLFFASQLWPRFRGVLLLYQGFAPTYMRSPFAPRRLSSSFAFSFRPSLTYLSTPNNPMPSMTNIQSPCEKHLIADGSCGASSIIPERLGLRGSRAVHR